jgi:hypothetical protein
LPTPSTCSFFHSYFLTHTASISIISLLRQRLPPTFSTCPSSPFLPHTALILNSAPNLHFADRRRCHDDTNTHYPLCRRPHAHLVPTFKGLN